MPTLYWGPWLAKIRRGGPEGALVVVWIHLDNTFLMFGHIKKKQDSNKKLIGYKNPTLYTVKLRAVARPG